MTECLSPEQIQWIEADWVDSSNNVKSLSRIHQQPYGMCTCTNVHKEEILAELLSVNYYYGRTIIIRWSCANFVVLSLRIQIALYPNEIRSSTQANSSSHHDRVALVWMKFLSLLARNSPSSLSSWVEMKTETGLGKNNHMRPLSFSPVQM